MATQEQINIVLKAVDQVSAELRAVRKDLKGLEKVQVDGNRNVQRSVKNTTLEYAKLAAGIGATYAVAKRLINIQREDERSKARLRAVVQNVTGDYGRWGQQIESVAGMLEKRTGFAIEEQRKALATLVIGFEDVEKALEALPVVLDSAAVSESGLMEVTRGHLRFLTGQANTLESLGIAYKEAGRDAKTYATDIGAADEASQALTSSMKGTISTAGISLATSIGLAQGVNLVADSSGKLAASIDFVEFFKGLFGEAEDPSDQMALIAQASDDMGAAFVDSTGNMAAAGDEFAERIEFLRSKNEGAAAEMMDDWTAMAVAWGNAQKAFIASPLGDWLVGQLEKSAQAVTMMLEQPELLAVAWEESVAKIQMALESLFGTSAGQQQADRLDEALKARELEHARTALPPEIRDIPAGPFPVNEFHGPAGPPAANQFFPNPDALQGITGPIQDVANVQEQHRQVMIDWADTLEKTMGKAPEAAGDALAPLPDKIAPPLEKGTQSVFEFADSVPQGVNFISQQLGLGPIMQGVNAALGGAAAIDSLFDGALSDFVGDFFSGLDFFAGGVENYKGGLAVVGEKGPELRYLPPGTSIIPNGPSAALARAAGIPGFAGGTGQNTAIQAASLALAFGTGNPFGIAKGVFNLASGLSGEDELWHEQFGDAREMVDFAFDKKRITAPDTFVRGRFDEAIGDTARETAATFYDSFLDFHGGGVPTRAGAGMLHPGDVVATEPMLQRIVGDAVARQGTNYGTVNVFEAGSITSDSAMDTLSLILR